MIQGLATLMIITGAISAIWSLHSSASLLTGISIEQTALALLVSGSIIHFILNASASVYTSPAVYDDSGRETGTVKWFNITKGFGFITRDLGDDIFVHYRAIRGEGHRTLSEGQRVEFVVVDKDKGLQAEDVIAAARGR